MLSIIPLISLFSLVKAVPQATSSSDCVGTISSLSDVNAAVQCKTVNINGFTVPAGQTFSLDLLQGTTVNVLGDIQFGNKSWEGPLFEVQGQDITFNGNGKTWNGGGPYYWASDAEDSVGGNGGVTKPAPMMRVAMSGTLSHVHVVNSPQRCFAIDNPGPLVVQGAIVDDSQGNYPNDKSNGRPAGHNTDGFDVSGDNVVIKNSVVINQDDCLAINRGTNITFEDNYCNGGHGISIGSIASNTVVENVLIRANSVVNSAQAFRIKTDKTATNSRVAKVTYSGNAAKNCSSYGVLITQSYPDAPGNPGNGVIISDVNFAPHMNEVEVESSAKMAVVDCGANSCDGKWNWAFLKTSGGGAGHATDTSFITGYTL